MNSSGRVASEDRGTVQQPGDVLSRDAVVHSDVHALVAEVVGHRQALHSPAVGQAVADEVHAPHLVDIAGHLQRHALGRRAAHLLALAHSQVGLAVQAPDALVVDARKLRAQQIVDAPVAEAPARMGDLDDPPGQLARGGIRLGWMAIAVTGEPHKTTRSALGQVVFFDHLANRLALDLWG